MESALLLRHGHQVLRYTKDNRRIPSIGRMAVAVRAVWSAGSRYRLLRILERERPALAHFHNTFPLISPSAYDACRRTGIPVVQTLHNYRLLCAAALFYRDGLPCEDCLGKPVLWPAVMHGCYRDSRLETTGIVAALQTHRILGIWRQRIDLYIALSAFSRDKFIQGGIPAEKIVVKPNFVAVDPGVREGNGDYAIYVGRLSAEKGIETLLDAWRRLRNIPLLIVGDGPLLEKVRRRARFQDHSSIRVLGRLSRPGVFAAVKKARFLVFPSHLYETFGLAIIEAFACGIAVVSPDDGVPRELVDDGRTGIHFHARDPESLADAVSRLWSDPSAVRRMGRCARGEFEAKYTAKRNYELLSEIYSTLHRT
jgi:glycosyltransferase involved in cell wall biosynthesis